MKKILGLICLLVVGICSNQLSAQAMIQAIHNSPDVAASTVDVYANGNLLLDDFNYRTATPFLPVAAGVPIRLGVAPGNSSSVADTLTSFGPFTLVNGQSYVIIAQGVIAPSLYDPANTNADINFELAIITPAEMGTAGDNDFEVAVSHGAPDAPDVDVFVNGEEEAALNDVPYSTNTGGYLTIPTGEYIFTVAASADSTNPVATYFLDASGLADSAAVVFASGFLTPGDEPAGASSFGLFAALPGGTVVELSQVGTAEVQVIHNSPDPAAATVDIYVDIITDTIKLDDVDFREATAFLEIPSGQSVRIGVAGANSTNISQSLQTFGPLVLDTLNYVVIAQGVLDPMMFDPNNTNANIGFELEIIEDASQTSSDPDDFDVTVAHGAVDAPDVDIFANGLTLLNDFPYGETLGFYLPVPEGDYVFSVAASADSTNPVGSYYFDGFIGGEAVVIFASGFLTPGDEPAGAEAFGLFAAFPDGTVEELQATGTSRVQVIHNSPDPAAATVDIYVDIITDTIKLDNVDFRTATAFLEIPSGQAVYIAVAGANSTSIDDALEEFGPSILDDGEDYVIIAQGVLNPAQFDPNNTNPDIEFELEILTPALQTAPAGNINVAVSHGSVDAPDVDIFANANPTALLNDVPYGATSGGYLTVPATEYVFSVAASADSANPVARFYLDAAPLDGGAAVVLASGFLSPADEPTGAEGFTLIAVLPNGDVEELTAVNTTGVQVIHNAADPGAATVDIYVDILTDTIKLDDVDFRTATAYLDLPTGYPLTIGVAGPNSTNLGDALETRETPVLMEGTDYQVIANGLLDPSQFAMNPSGNMTGFDLYYVVDARRMATAPTMVDLYVFHGATDAPTVDILANGSLVLVDDISYSEGAGYATVMPATYDINVALADDSTTLVKTYIGDVAGLAGGAGTILASGFLDSTVNQDGPAFGLLLVLPDGTAELLPETVNTSVSPDIETQGGVYGIYPNPAVGLTELKYRVAQVGPVSMELYDMQGRRVMQRDLGSQAIGDYSVELRLDALEPGNYALRLIAPGVQAVRRLIVK